MKHRFNRFRSYSNEDCACNLCLYYPGTGKPCPLPVCCCEEEKRATPENSTNQKSTASFRCRPNPLLPENPACFVKPECEGCPYPAHGFLCHSTDDFCLKPDASPHNSTSGNAHGFE